MRIFLLLAMFAGSHVSAMTCADDLAIAVSKPFRLPDDRLVVEISHGPGTRRIEIPSWVMDLAGTPNLKAIVLAGNSGADESGLEYFKTRHSLAHVFGESFLDRHFVQSQGHAGAPGGGEHRYVDTVKVSYDDGTVREWTAPFRTTFPLYRTETGEIFFLPDQDAIVIKAIGDYNEIGDFATVITDLMGVLPKDTLLVRDNLDTPQGQIELREAKPAEYQGNNAVLSMIRTLGYQTLRQVKPKLLAYVTDEQWASLDRAVRRQLDARGAGLVENVEGLLEPYRKFVLKDVFRTRSEQIPERLQMKEARRPIGALIAESKKPDTSEARRAEIALAIERVKRETSALESEIPPLEARIVEDNERLIAEIREVLLARLSFAELVIGTGDGSIPPGKGNGSLKADFVLKPFPEHVFNEKVWAVADAQIVAWLKAPPAIRGGARIK